MRQLMLITGSMCSGKTTFCSALFDILRSKSLSPFSILEENIRDARGIPLSLALHDQGSGETIPLGSRGSGIPLPGRPYPAFIFSTGAFRWALAKVKAAVAQGCGPVMIDEAGPLEANEGGGFFPAIEWAMENGACPLLVTIRSDLEEAFIDRFRKTGRFLDARSFPISVATFDMMLRTVSDDVFRHCQDRKGTIYYT